MVRACVKDGQWTAASLPVKLSDALFHNWREKSRKTTKEVDREYKTTDMRNIQFDEAMERRTYLDTFDLSTHWALVTQIGEFVVCS